MSHSEVKWSAPEFEYRGKNISWYWLSIVIAVVFLGAAVWQKNFLFGFFVIVGEILLLVWAERKPRVVDFRLNEQGLEIVGQRLYLYTDLESFSIDENPGGELPQLIIRFHGRLRPILRIFLPKRERPKIEEVISGFVREEDYAESFLDNLEKFLRF